MTRVEVELDAALLDEAAQILNTSTPEETLKSALDEVVAMRRRVEALERLREMARNGAIDMEFLSDKRNYRPRPMVHDLPLFEDDDDTVA
jgi:Arc/MetJ family transcription regulator